MQRYPQPGCIVEFMESNTPQIAMVLDGDENRLRLLLPSRREVKLAANRILPWYGPCFNPGMGREEAIRILEEHKKIRERRAGEAPLLEAWEMAQGEIGEAPAEWFAELFESTPTEDTVAAFGRALLELKSHFRFQSPRFQVYDAQTVEKRLYEEKIKNEREALVAGGAAFLRQLWSIAQSHGAPPPKEAWPNEATASRIREMLFDRLRDPEIQKDDTLWSMVSKSLPDVPHLPLQLLTAWGLLPPHYNFWLDRADFERGDGWWEACAGEVENLAEIGQNPPEALPLCGLPFISIDSAKTRDIDDAFFVLENGNEFTLTLALACPALRWNFSGSLDRLVRKRATSIYLPEGDLHMLPEKLGLEAYSLEAGKPRAALCITIKIDSDGQLLETKPFFARVRLAANLSYPQVEKVLAGEIAEENPAADFGEILRCGQKLADLRKQLRIRDGAVIMDRVDPKILLEGDGWNTRVLLFAEEQSPISQEMVAEMMIAASAGIAHWAQQNGLPLFHRTQDVAVPKEYAGVWSKPEDIAKVMKALAPSAIETEGKKHAALAVAQYAPITSPLRRYTDLVNEAQIMHFLETGTPLFDVEALKTLLAQIAGPLEGAGHAQRFRPRYWKLLHILQAGPKAWWHGVITEENDIAVSVNMPREGVFVRGKRRLFDERACPGMAVRMRLGKINPLYNEIQIIEVEATE